jgi:hypothetical protein
LYDHIVLRRSSECLQLLRTHQWDGEPLREIAINEVARSEQRVGLLVAMRARGPAPFDAEKEKQRQRRRDLSPETEE